MRSPRPSSAVLALLAVSVILVPFTGHLRRGRLARDVRSRGVPRHGPSPAAEGLFDPERLERAIAQWNRLPRAFSPSSPALGSIAGTVWKPIGPNPIVEPGCCGSPFTFAANGRVNSIAVDPTNSSVLYLGSAGGGVWKTVDGGAHWMPMTDQEISLGIGSSHAIAIDPNHPNTIYAGTSSWSLLNPGDRAQSRGILKSTDGGASWIVLGSGFPTGNDGNAESFFRDRNISTILVDPADSQMLYLAAGRAGDAIAGGVFRSEDGGLNWAQGTGTEGLRVESLVLDTSSPPGARVLYAGAETRGVLKSTDGGKSWTEVLKPSTVTTEAPNGFYKVMVALAPPATPPNMAGPVVYASLQLNDAASKNLLHVIFRNTNGGMEGDWEKRDGQVLTFLNSDLSQLFGGGFSDMVVDPASPGDGSNDRIYWGGLSQYLSTDSGDTFDEIGQVHGIHGDHQAWLVVPHAGLNTLWVGDDGGIWRSDDAGATWTGTGTSPPASLASTLNAGGLQTATLYQLAVQADAGATATLAGTQDSGVLRLPLPPPVPSLPAGSQPWSGTSNDGIDVAFDRVTTDVAYCIQNASFLKSLDGGASWTIDFTSQLPASQVSIFINRLAVDPNNAGYLYVGGSAGSGNPFVPAPGDVLQSMDGATSFRALGLMSSAFVTSMDVAPGDSNHLVAASARQVFVTTNALASTVGLPSGVVFRDITGDLPSRFVTRVAFDPHDASIVYATLAGFGTGHVFTKSINTANWTDISPDVDIPVQSMALDGGSNPAILYVGTELGVLRRSVAGGGAWEVVDDLRLPNAAVADLEINSTAGVLRAGTWGRGVFELAAPTGPAIFVAPPILEIEEACAVTGKNGTIGVSNVGTQDLVVSSVQRLAGSSAFTVLASPATPLTIGPGNSATFTVHYTPTVPAIAESATIRITSNDPTVPFVDVPVSGTLETTPPIINSLTATPNVLLKPSNHKMVPVTVSVAVTDNCDPSVAQSCHIESIVSNEPVSGTGEGDTDPDWEITGNLTANIRAERAGSGSGRVYTIFVRCTDNAGNSSGTATQVMVPH
jgi:hypothetical protein